MLNRSARGWRTHLSKRMWLLLALLALLPLMAFLQYRWIGQVSDAAGERAKARLEHSVEQMITEFDGEVTRAHMAFRQQPPELEDPAAGFAELYRDWNRLAPYPQLIHGVYLIETVEAPWRLSRIDSSGEITTFADWPADFAAVRSRIGGPSDDMRRPGAFDDLTVNGNPVFLVPMRGPRGDREPREREPRGKREPGRRPRRPFPRPSAWGVVAFDSDFIRREFLPDLTKRLFTHSGEYELAIVDRADPERIIYQTDPAPARGIFTSPDAMAGLLAVRPGCFQPGPGPGGRGGGRGFGPGGPGPSPFPRGRSTSILTQKSTACGPAARESGKMDGEWRLLVTHRAGSLASSVATLRLRTMAISFGVLLVLALGITMLTVSTERARVLAKLQMEFAMGISHELRTPLTVIRVAADNLANGMMENTRHAQKYGRLIGDEARRLTDMVEQILTFARTQSPGSRSDLTAVQPEQTVRRALASFGPALREAGMVVECSIEPGLPNVFVDENLIVDCIKNLLYNAVKYAASGGWVRVRAESASGGRVRIGVEDRGPGVAPGDLTQIFDPFYRGEAVRNSQIPGVGLGLSLVKRIVEAHQGAVEVESSVDSGATFFLYLPAQPVAIKEVAS